MKFKKAPYMYRFIPHMYHDIPSTYCVTPYMYNTIPFMYMSCFICVMSTWYLSFIPYMYHGIRYMYHAIPGISQCCPRYPTWHLHKYELVLVVTQFPSFLQGLLRQGLFPPHAGWGVDPQDNFILKPLK